MGSEWAPPLNPIATPPSTRERVEWRRVLILMLASLGGLLTSLFALEWFTARMPNGLVSGFAGVTELSIDLRSVSTCEQAHGTYCQTPLKYMAQYAGFHPYITLATATLWASLAFAAIVLLQAASRLLTDAAHKSVTIIGYVVGLVTMSCACATAYAFGPEFASFNVEPTLAPVVLLLGCVLGIAALSYAAKLPTDAPSKATIPIARARTARS